MNCTNRDIVILSLGMGMFSHSIPTLSLPIHLHVSQSWASQTQTLIAHLNKSSMHQILTPSNLHFIPCMLRQRPSHFTKSLHINSLHQLPVSSPFHCINFPLHEIPTLLRTNAYSPNSPSLGDVLELWANMVGLGEWEVNEHGVKDTIEKFKDADIEEGCFKYQLLAMKW